jgi:hypothetical protein
MADGGDGTVIAFPAMHQDDRGVLVEDNPQPLGHPFGARPGDSYPPTEVHPDAPSHEIKFIPAATQAQLFCARLRELADSDIQTAIRKNSDYASPDRPFANFEQAPAIGVSVARGLLVRMQDKMSRLSNLLDRPAAVAEESRADTLSDLRNYAYILQVWLEWHGDGQS